MKQHYLFNPKILAFFLLLAVVSCSKAKKEEGEFRGFAPLCIGVKFDTLPEFAMFKKQDDGTFDADRVDLSCGIGIVDRVTVTTKADKISSVAFTATELTEKKELDHFLKKLKADTPFNNLNLDNEHIKLKMFVSKDGKIALSRTQNSSSPAETDYYYFDVRENKARQK